ncbi:hypothetical protein WJX82_007726 [Trebouxia sp. C0006]
MRLPTRGFLYLHIITAKERHRTCPYADDHLQPDRRCRITSRVRSAATDHHTFYSVLGVSRDATLAEVKTAYRRLAIKWHPDHASGAEARETYQAIKDAYDVLSNHTKRHHYNKHGIDGLGSHFHRYEATHGRTKSYGSCPACGGKGVSSRFWCKRCGGEGRAVTPRHVRVKIPAGVDHGSVLRLNGQGDVGTFCGQRGDIILRFVIHPEDSFTRHFVVLQQSRRHSVLLSWLRSVSKACFGKNQLLEPVVSLDVISPREAVDRVQAGVVEAVLYLDISAARGRKGHLGFTHRLGNKAFSYSLPIQPRSALVQPLTFSTPGIHSGVYAVELSRTQCRLCHKALADLVPQSPVVSEEHSASRGRAATCDFQCIAKGGLQEILKIACQRADDSVTLPPQLRETLVLLLAAAPKGSELVRDVVAAIEQGLDVACSLSVLPELVLSLLQLPDVCLAARTSGLRSSLVMYFQRHRPLDVRADVSIPIDTPQPQVSKKWYFKSLLHRTKARYQAAAQERSPLASIGTPAYLQALHQQRLAEEESSQHHSFQRRSQEAASRHASIELGARAPSAISQYLFEAVKVWGPVQEELSSFGPVAFWTQRRTMLMTTMVQLQTAWLNGQWRAGEAARALRGYLGNQSAGTIYLAFVQHHLTVHSSTEKTVEVPPDGPCLAILQDRSRPEGQRLAALQTLVMFYGCNYNPIIADAHSATYACRLHFQGFVDAYASEDLQMSRQHLAALQALAKHKVEVVRQHLYELCVMDFLIRNIGLEAELTGHPGLDSGLALVKAAEAGSARQKLPPDFVSKGDLEEDMQQLLEMDSQSDISDSSSMPSSPLQSSRLTPKRPLLPALNLAGSARKGGPANLPTPLSSFYRRLTDDKPSLGSPASASKAASLRATPHILILTPLSPKHSHSHSQADRLKMPKLNLSCSAGLSAVQLGHNSQDCRFEGDSTWTASAVSAFDTRGGNLALYEQKRARRFLYADTELHAQMLQLIVELLLTSKGQLDPLYCNSQDPSAQQPVSVLQQHLSWAGNASMSGPLLHWAKTIGPPAIRLLRLTCRFLFDKSMYEDKQRIARGAFAQVFTCRPPKFCADTPDLAFKITDLPTAGDNPISQMTAFKEIAIMQRQPEDACHQLRLYLNVFAHLASVLQAVSEQGVVHFDLKCDNVFLRALPGVSEQEFWSPASDEPPFEVVLGDFGDSHDFSQSGQDQISMNRGTECVRSPEMLLAASSTSKTALHASSTHAACDVWALACLLYELVTGNVLFPSDLDWPKFFITVTDANQELLSPTIRHSLEKLPAVANVLGYTLIRDPAQRPSAKDVLHRVQQALQDPRSNLSPYRQPVTLPLTPLKPLAAPALFLTPASTASCNHETSMADFYTNHLAAALKSCSAVGVQAKLIPVNVPEQPDEGIHQDTSLLQDRHKLQLTQWSSRMRKSEQSNRTPSGGTTFT